MRLRGLLPLAGMLAASGALAAVALATPPSGQTASTPVIGHLASGQQANTDRIKLQTKDQTDVSTYTVTYAGGGFSGWHTHPGVLLVTVQSGAVVRQVGCDATTYSAGDTFIESDEQPPGQVSNASATDQAVVAVTQITPRGSVRREDAAAAGC
jgi:quercetin dioxygenase-like cupin family protein